jgi:hypothetical protein
MRRLFLLFLKAEQLTIETVPTPTGIRELTINFAAWSKGRARGVGKFEVRKWMNKYILEQALAYTAFLKKELGKPVTA